jgi:hypothetical protein
LLSIDEICERSLQPDSRRRQSTELEVPSPGICSVTFGLAILVAECDPPPAQNRDVRIGSIG